MGKILWVFSNFNWKQNLVKTER